MNAGFSFDSYLAAQEGNLVQVRRLPHFKLVERLHALYDVSIGMIPRSLASR